MRFGIVGSNNMLGGSDKGRASHPFFSVAEHLWSFDQLNLNTFWMHGMRCRDGLNQQIFKVRVHMVISLFISQKRFKKNKKNIYLWMSRHFQTSHSKRHHTGSSAICSFPAWFSCRKPVVVVIPPPPLSWTNCLSGQIPQRSGQDAGCSRKKKNILCNSL